MILNKENTFTEQNRFLVYSDQLNATRKQILDTAEEMISRSAIQTFEDEGETITAIDASYLASLIADGKAVQNGTPTPNVPVPIQVVGLNDDNEFGIQIGETLYPINLQGNILASLPDGTKDILTVDSVGHVVLEKHTNEKILDGTENWSNSTAFAYTGKPSDIADGQGSETPNILMTNRFKVEQSSSGGNCYISGANILFYKDGYFNPSSGAEAKTWATTNNITLLYKLATPQTIDLGYISMPTIPDGSTISITAQVAPTIAAKWWTKNQSDVAAALSAISSDLASLDARVAALESANAKSLVLEKPETVKEKADTLEEQEEQEEMPLEDVEE